VEAALAATRLLIIGGSGFVSGTLARQALALGHEVWCVTRGQRPMAPGVRPITVDRKDRDAFASAIKAVGVHFDLAVDCIAYEPADVQSDIAALRGRVSHLVMISTDFVYDPASRVFPQTEDNAAYSPVAGYGANKRACELVLINQPQDAGTLPWTIFRPCHIYGPGSLLGCSPPNNRDAKLIEKIKAGEPIDVVGASYLQQPIFAPDLARLMLSVVGNPAAVNRVFNAAGPEMVESHMYYRLVARALGLPIEIRQIDPVGYLAQHPDKAPFLCHRIYDLTRLHGSGLKTPDTPLAVGLAEHVRSLIG
jgi:nucleoside-diphosphate-sugar epimerase